MEATANQAAVNQTAGTMDFGGFVAAVRERLQARYPGCDVRTEPVEKNNGVHLTGIVILPEGENVSPNIYMEDFYRKYLDGETMEDIVSEASRLYEENRVQEDFRMPDVTDFDAVRDTICFRLVNRERNSEALKAMPHRQFLDLAITYYIPMSVSRNTSGRIAVTDKIFRMWQVDEETMYRHALENTRRLFPVELRALEEVMREVFSGGNAGAGAAPSKKTASVITHFPMYILRCVNGDQANAAAVLYGSVLREFAERNGDFYILPSSVFEVLLVPAPGPADSKYYSSIVREINQTQLLPDEVLSDNAYYYHADTGAIDVLE